jgi:hypothetical protein
MIPLRSERLQCCCRRSTTGKAGSLAARGEGGVSIARRSIDVAGWLVPGVLLAFFPKCPLCVASYVAIATGLGISLTAATYLRSAVLVLCLGSLAMMAGRRWKLRRK